MAVIKNNINFGNQNIKRVYRGSDQITQIWKRIDDQNKLLYYYGDGSQGLTYEIDYADEQKSKLFTQIGTSPKYGYATPESGTVYPIEYSLNVTDPDGVVISVQAVTVTPTPISEPTISGTQISFTINPGEPEKTVAAKINVTYTLRTKVDSTDLVVTGIAEEASPFLSLNIPQDTFEFGDQNKIGTVTAIGARALSGNDSTKIQGAVTFPNTVETIGADAFLNCAGITQVTISESVTSIGLAAFACCPSLKNVFWNAINCTEAGSGHYPIFGTYPDIGTTGMQDTAITNVVIGDNVESLPAYVFSGCSSLVNIDIGRGVKSIGTDAFRGDYTDTKDVVIDDLRYFCQINFANQYANPLNLSGGTRLYKTDFKGERTEITSIDTDSLYSSGSEVTLPVLFQRCYNIKKVEINSDTDTVVKVVHTNGSTDSVDWSISTLNIVSCGVGSYFDEGIFSDSFETVLILFASTWAAYDGDVPVTTISPTGPSSANWSSFFNNNIGYKIQRIL
mgnify:CR=1 FL=1